VQRAIRKASRQEELTIRPQELRQAHAAHRQERSVNPRTMQKMKGSRPAQTTMTFVDAKQADLVSPLD
jgi:hypothetical protein